MDNKRTNAAKKCPDFFKLFVPEIHSERMLVPNAFVKMARQQGWEPRDIILKNRSGEVWEVRTLAIDDHLYFDDGWKQFRKDNCLEAMDTVFFTHVGNNVFNFTICELSTRCEKMKVEDSTEELEKERDDVMELDKDYPGKDDSDHDEEEEEEKEEEQ